MAIQINLLMWASESWALKKSLVKSFDVFLRRSTRRALGITILDARNEHVNNETIRKIFFNTLSTQKMIKIRQLLLLGKVARNSNDQTPSKLLTSRTFHKRRPGIIVYINRRIIVESLAWFVPNDSSKSGSLLARAFMILMKAIVTN